MDLPDTVKFPSRKVGTHRRVLLHDMLEYKRVQREARLKVLEEMAKEAQEMGLYGV